MGKRMGKGEKNGSSAGIICSTINNVFNKSVGLVAFLGLLHYIHLYILDVGGEPDKLCKFFEVIGLRGIALTIFALLVSGVAYFERRGKKRAIKKLGECRRNLEQYDPARTSSGLTDTGETPGEEE